MTSDECTVYELRQYTLQPGSRDAFVRLFESELLDAQDAAGMHIVGQFRDLDRPDVFVWMRGFTSMRRRFESLTAFYDGPVWAAHRNAANAMMIDSDDVLLLEPAEVGRSLAGQVAARPPLAASSADAAELMVAICPLVPADTNRYLRAHRRQLAPLLRRCGGRPLPPLLSLHAPNTFPRLPVREDEHVVVTVTLFPDHLGPVALRANPGYRTAADELDTLASGPVHRLRLAPTPRSALR